MNNKIRYTLQSVCFFLSAMLFLSGCTDYDKADAGIEVSATELKADYRGLTQVDEDELSFVITSNTSWSIDTDVDWITPSHGNGAETTKVFLKLELNGIFEDREATLIVSGAGMKREIKITQLKKVEELSLSPSNGLVVTAMGLTLDGEAPVMSLTTNSDWEISTEASWIKLDRTSGEELYPAISLEVDNNNGVEHAADIVVKSGSKTATLKVTQLAIRLELESEAINVNYLGLNLDGDRPTINLIADVEWESSVNVDWIVLKKASGKGSDSFPLEVKENETKKMRKGEITFASNGLTKVLTVTQYADDVYLDEDFSWITADYVNNSGVPIPDYMSDFEKSSTPTINNVLNLANNPQLNMDWDAAGWDAYVKQGVGVSVYVVVGALKFGTSNRGGGIISPALAIEPGKTENAVLSFDVITNIGVNNKDINSPDYGTGNPDNPSVTVEITGSGTFKDGTKEKEIAVENKKWNDWQSKTLDVKGAKEDTQFIFRSTNMDNGTGASRWYLDNVKVAKSVTLK